MASELKTRFDGWFKSLSQRERLIVGAGGILLLVAVLILGMLMPLQKALAARQARVDVKQADLTWMRGSVNAVRSAAMQSGGGPGESLVVLINRTAQQNGLAAALVNQAPTGEHSIRVRLERGQFDSIVSWLGTLEQQFGVRVDNASIDRADKPGVVNASFVLTRAP